MNNDKYVGDVNSTHIKSSNEFHLAERWGWQSPIGSLGRCCDRELRLRAP